MEPVDPAPRKLEFVPIPTTDFHLTVNGRPISRPVIRAVALLLAAAPFGVAVLRVVRTGNDWRYFWVALAAFFGAAIVILTNKARAHRRNAAFQLWTMGVLVSTLLGVIAARLLGARAVFGIVAVSLVFALFFTTSVTLYSLTRGRQ